eukprot:3066746-Rhodomonas_salina.1
MVIVILTLVINRARQVHGVTGQVPARVPGYPVPGYAYRLEDPGQNVNVRCRIHVLAGRRKSKFRGQSLVIEATGR